MFSPYSLVFLKAKLLLSTLNSAVTVPSFALFLISEKSALAPTAKPREVKIMDFPAPVSPEKL